MTPPTSPFSSAPSPTAPWPACSSPWWPLVLVAGGIYKIRHTRVGAIIGLVCGTVCMGLVMMVANHFITPAFMGAPVEVVDAMLLPVILPFNLIKAGINSLVTFLIYKTISRHIIHGEGWKKKEEKAKLNGEPVE